MLGVSWLAAPATVEEESTASRRDEVWVEFEFVAFVGVEPGRLNIL